MNEYPSARELGPARNLYTAPDVTKHGYIKKKAGGFKLIGVSNCKSDLC